MLPDFPKLKVRLMDRHIRDVRAKVDAKMPVVSRIRAVRFHEGDCFSFERDDGVVESKGFVDISAPIQIDGVRPGNTMADGSGQSGIGYFAALAA